MEEPVKCESIHRKVNELAVDVAVLKSKIEADDKALELQSREYARRLEILNNAHLDAEKERKTYVTRELHDQLYQEMLRRLETLTSKADFEKVSAQVKYNTERFGEGFARNDGRNAVIAAIASGIFGLAGLIISIYHAFIEKIAN